MRESKEISISGLGGLSEKDIEKMENAVGNSRKKSKVEINQDLKGRTAQEKNGEIKRSAEEDKNNNNQKNMEEKEKGEKIADKKIDKDSMSKEEQDEILEARKKEAEGQKEARERSEGEKKEKKKSPELEEKWEEEQMKRTEARKTEIYRKRSKDLEKFSVETDLQKNIQGILQGQMNETLVKQGREWLKEQVEDNPDEYPELAGQDIDEFEDVRVMDYVKYRENFWDLFNENEEWRKADNLRKSIEDFKENLPPDVKVLIFKRLPDGPIREKIWEKLTGENLERKAIIEAGIGTEEKYVEGGKELCKKEYVESEVERFKISERNKFFGHEWREFKAAGVLPSGYMELPREERERWIRDLDVFTEGRINYLKNTLGKRLKREIEEVDIVALLKQGYSAEKIEKMKKPLFRKKIKIKGEKGKIKMERFEEIIKDGKEEIVDEISNEEIKQKEFWELVLNGRKEKILEDEAEKTSDEMINNCYEKLGRDVAARWLEKEINKDPKRKAEIEKEFGKGEGKEFKKNLYETLKGTEVLKGKWEEDAEDMEELLKGWGVNPEKLSDKQKAAYEQFSEKKLGIFDWIFAIIFGEI